VPFGALSDRYGRRKLLLFGTLLFCVSSYLATMAHNIYVLLFIRFLEGIAVASCNGVLRAVVPDVFVGVSYKKVIVLMSSAFALGPIISPFIGGYLQHYFGWHAPFYFLSAYGAILFSMTLFILPETHLKPTVLKTKIILSQIKSALTHKLFLGGILIGGLAYSFVVVYNVMAPFIVQDTLGKTAVYYGYIALILGVGQFMGNITNRFLIHYSAKLKIKVAAIISAILALITIVLATVIRVNIVALVIPTFFIFVCSGIMIPNAMQKTLGLFPEFAGVSNSLFGSILFGITAIIAMIASLFHAHTLLPIALLYSAIAVVILLIYTIFYAKR